MFGVVAVVDFIIYYALSILRECINCIRACLWHNIFPIFITTYATCLYICTVLCVDCIEQIPIIMFFFTNSLVGLHIIWLWNSLIQPCYIVMCYDRQSFDYQYYWKYYYNYKTLYMGLVYIICMYMLRWDIIFLHNISVSFLIFFASQRYLLMLSASQRVSQHSG
jgi:hypothetical protein